MSQALSVPVRTTVLLSLGLALATGTAHVPELRAQNNDPFGLPETGISGSVGATGGLYGISGIDNRRPSAYSEVSADLSFKLLGFESGLSLLYSTESNSLRQSMNRLGFSWSWDWGQVEAGTISPSYSEYSLNGATLRGGSVELTPGPMNLALSAGRTQRAISPSSDRNFRQSAFERWLYAARVGVGAQERSHFHLIGTVARDRKSSLNQPSLDQSPPDQSGGQTGSIRPAENLTITPDFGISLFEGRVQLQTEATVSALTRDTRTRRVDLGVPILEDLFTPRAGSRIDYAGTSRLKLDLSGFQFDAAYERIQPDFRSLGVSRIRTDQETVRINPRVQLFDGKLSVGTTLKRVRNNLLGQRAVEEQRRQVRGNVQARLGRSVTINGSYMRMINDYTPTASDSGFSGGAGNGTGSQPPLSEAERRLVTQTATLAPTITVQSGSLTHSLSLSGNYQLLDSQSNRPSGGSRPSGGGRPAPDSESLTTTASYSLSFPSGLSLTLSGDYLRSNAQATSTNAYGANASAGYAFFGRTLRVNLSGGWSENRTQGGQDGGDQRSRQFRFNGTASYRLPFGDTVQLKGRLLSNRVPEGQGRPFQEGQLTVRFNHQF